MRVLAWQVVSNGDVWDVFDDVVHEMHEAAGPLGLQLGPAMGERSIDIRMIVARSLPDTSDIEPWTLIVAPLDNDTRGLVVVPVVGQRWWLRRPIELKRWDRTQFRLACSDILMDWARYHPGEEVPKRRWRPPRRQVRGVGSWHARFQHHLIAAAFGAAGALAVFLATRGAVRDAAVLGSVAEWIAAIGTVGALAYTAVGVTRELQRANDDRADLADARRRAQAEKVSCTCLGTSAGASGPTVSVELRNGSDDPVSDIYVDTYATQNWRDTSVGMAHHQVGPLAPASVMRLDLPVDAAALGLKQHTPVGMSFIDAKGQPWKRLPGGRLKEWF